MTAYGHFLSELSDVVDSIRFYRWEDFMFKLCQVFFLSHLRIVYTSLRVDRDAAFIVPTRRPSLAPTQPIPPPTMWPTSAPTQFNLSGWYYETFYEDIACTSRVKIIYGNLIDRCFYHGSGSIMYSCHDGTFTYHRILTTHTIRNLI